MFLAKGARCEYSLTEQSHLVFFFPPALSFLNVVLPPPHLDWHVVFFFFFFSPSSAYCILSHLVKCYHSVVYEKRGGKKKHTNTLTSPRPNKCRLDPTRHIVKTHLSSVHNPSCVNQMITPYRENFRVQR